MPEPSHLSATRATYDIVAADYAALVPGLSAETAVDRAVLAAFAELVHEAGGGPVADLGCGPGRLTAHLHSLGVSAFGVDLSPQMVAVALLTYPLLRFEEGSITALDIGDGALAGALAWYSIIHTPPEQMPTVLAEFHRVLAPGGHLLVGFQVGDGLRHLSNAYGHDVSCDAYLLSPDRMADLMGAAGLVVSARLVREARGREKTPQAALLARKPMEP